MLLLPNSGRIINVSIVLINRCVLFQGSQGPMTLLEQSAGLKVTLHAGSAQVPKVSASLRPKTLSNLLLIQFIPSLKDVSVFVVSTTSSNSSPIANYTFQAVVPKVRPFMLPLFHQSDGAHLFCCRDAESSCSLRRTINCRRSIRFYRLRPSLKSCSYRRPVWYVLLPW